MSQKTGSVQIAWIQGGILVGTVLLLGVATSRITADLELRAGNFALELTVLVLLAALTRRYGIPLPGKGFASFLFAVILTGLLLRDWYFAVIVGAIGTPTGDFFFRRLRIRGVLNNIGHIVVGTGLTGIAYDLMGGAHGQAALAPDNLAPLLVAILLLPALVNGTFYLEHALATGFAWVDARLTLRWELVSVFFSAALAVAAVALATSGASLAVMATWGLALTAGTMIVLVVLKQAVAADELRLVQGLADAVAADVSIGRSFARIQELTRLLVPWDQMGFARYDPETDEMELVADTGTQERLRFPAGSGLSGEAVRTGRAVVAQAASHGEMVLPEGERPGSEVLIPLNHGGRLVGLWSVRHSDETMYRPADAELLNLLAPQLALAVALSEILSPMRRSSEQAASSMRELQSGRESVRESARQVDLVSGRAAEGANRAASQVKGAVNALARLSEGINHALDSARQALEAIGKTAGESRSLHETSREAVSRLRDLSAVIERGASDVAGLRDAATEVESFSQAIGSIANQTNLLALNATIESARAGIHGKGFRVVAEEVRKLADESGRAARNISRSAQSTKKVIDESARLLDDLRRQLGELAGASETWVLKLSDIVGTAEESRRAGERMVQYPEENRRVADEAASLLRNAEEAAESSAADAARLSEAAAAQLQDIEEMSKGAAELGRLAAQLEAAARFVTGHNGGGNGEPE